MISSVFGALIFIIIALALFFISSVKAVQFICLFSIFILIFCYLYSQILKKSIKVDREIKYLKIACKEKVEITLYVKNFSRLPCLLCYIFDEVPYLYVYGDKNTDLITLRPKEIRKFTYTVSAQDRGLYHAGPVKIKTSDPLGLFHIDKEEDCNMDIIVRPAKIPFITEIFPGLPQGSLKINNFCYEDITIRKSIREYNSTDEMRRINWRTSAKTGNLFTNVYENTYYSNIFVFLNLAEDDYPMQMKFYGGEKAIELAASIIEEARKLRQNAGFAAYGTDFPFIKPAQNQWDNILDVLSVIKMEKGRLSFDPYTKFKSQLPTHSLVFVIGPKEVEIYRSKIEANQQQITSESIGIRKRGIL